MANTYRLFSADSHLEISPQRWTERVPQKYRDRAPRLIKLPNGGDGIIVEGQPVYVLGLAVAGRPYEHHQLTGLNYATSAGAGSAEQRLKEQDHDGIDGEVLFTSAGNLSFWRGIRNDEAYLAVLHAYNEFLVEEYTACNRDRLLAMGVIPAHSVAAAVKEMEYCAKAGLKGVLINTFPSGKLYPSAEDDHFWSASIDMNMPITVHVGLQKTDGPLFKYDRSPSEVAFGGDPVRVLTRFAGTSGLNAVQLVLSGVFDRHPKLKIYWAETQMGWLPYFYEQLDDVYKRSRYWMERDFGMAPLAREPSAYIREHCLWGFIYDPIGVRLRYEVGVDNIMWGNDFPHSAGDWPNSKRVIENMLSGVPENERQKILVDNAVKYFHLN
ncbi:MAG TPA: amidohydrolase family protein [Terriglobales bacterium]|nr:amidohydrolase family protein [Terriglobales bacterium]